MEAHGGLLQDFSFDYDRADNLTRMATPDGTTIMRPDSTNAIRMLIQRRSGLPGPDRIHPTYDKNGNLTDDGAHHYTWDGLNHLTGITYHGHPRWHTTLSYDGLDHLVTITERDGQDRETRHLLWCGEAICAITDDQGQLITRLFDQGEWQQGKVLYYTKDHLGSIRDVLGTLPPVGELINLAGYDYGPYGERLDEGRRNARVEANLGYAGMFFHARSGLYLTHYRAYDPRLGRWLSRDPIWEAGGVNLYGYVGGDPQSWSDPSGLAIGDYPPPPPGYDPQTWIANQYRNGRWYLINPEGRRYVLHPEDRIHWRHWDEHDPTGKKGPRWPPNSFKPNTNSPKSQQCPEDPSGDAPPWVPPVQAPEPQEQEQAPPNPEESNPDVQPYVYPIPGEIPGLSPLPDLIPVPAFP